MRPAVLWLRRDLRVRDHPALRVAAELGDGAVAPLFVVDGALARPSGPARAAFVAATLAGLEESTGGALAVRVGDPAAQVARLCEELGARDVVATADFGPYGRRRDVEVAAAAAARGVSVTFVDSPYAVAPGTLRSSSGAPYRVFTPYWRAWLDPARAAARAAGAAAPPRWVAARSEGTGSLAAAAARSRPRLFDGLPDGAPRVTDAGEAAAWARLGAFLERVERYADERNRPGADATSRLSPHLKVGAIHPRSVLGALGGPGEGRAALERELAWREFYADVLWREPRSARAPLSGAAGRIRVDRDAGARARFRAWARGETGYPLVDAGMRQLLDEGWMHNRVRMVAASFLVKHLHLDWRWGARWFMWRLIDGDLASNQHGWQWVAGTGTDAAPYHRVFNPTLQAHRFDPEGTYVRRHVGALADVPAPRCLEPGALGAPGYAAPMVDAAAERVEALERLAESRGGAR